MPLLTFVRPLSLNAVDGTWAACDDPWGCFLQDPAPMYGEPANLQRGKQFLGHSGTKWTPVDWKTWPNYDVVGVPTGKEGIY